MKTVDAILAELEQEAVATGKLIERIPADKLAWRPHPKSMSLGRLALHIAADPGLISTYAKRPNVDAATLLHQPEAASLQEIKDAFTNSLAVAREVLPALDEKTLAATWAVTDGEKKLWEITRGALLRVLMLNHLYHHRGQLTVYLRLLDIPLPPVY
ncbi:MAG: DinB family protein, partial [Blastocatellia bacterium]